ncbi:ATPase involved in DNA repair; chromosome segregation ATPase [Cytophaga hutchinsonii ATCC 33406]|uniref:ATPase involved in DNA repair chromosome segregation ATPase n=2 Tax=Cytophaga hutchinsonii TaxID=985 RepID=A0A6N4SMF5_CYTH3|nr:ATPase involved in DNA repair; chromosome segregation ATPase [Cytophaga hutchinsonii ATCC 33406]SFW97896.1 hypothetical protein SAMN04487930_1016 [Cytophaga hutchinsonii ATCC 33406]
MFAKIMKYLMSILAGLVLTISAVAQSQKTVEVVSGHAQVLQVDRQGMQVTLSLDEKFVTKNWLQKLKEYGKVESEKGGYVVHGATISGISQACTIYSTVFSGKTGTVVFWAIDMGDGYVTEGHNHYAHAKTKLKEFALSAYIADINVQIAAAEAALNSSVKNQEKLTKQGESLKNDTQKNAKEKSDLEKKLVDNEKELKALDASEVQIENRMKEVKATDNHEEQQKLLKESLSNTNNIEKNKQQKISLENKLKENENERLKLIEDTKTNASNVTAAKEEVAKMTKALEVVKDKLKAYQ